MHVGDHVNVVAVVHVGDQVHMVIRDHIDVVVGHRDEVNVMSHRDGGCGNRWWARVEGRKRHGGGGLLAAEEAEAAKTGEKEKETEGDETKETKETQETLLRGVVVERGEGQEAGSEGGHGGGRGGNEGENGEGTHRADC